MTTTLIHRTIDDVFETIGDRTPEVLAVGYDTERCMFVHFEPLSDEQMRSLNEWAGNADLRIEVSDTMHSSAIKEAATNRWPSVRFLTFACTCCSSEDLIHLNECGYCSQLDGHADGCPLLVPREGPARSDDAQMQAHYAYMRGYRAGSKGHRCGKFLLETLSERWKNRFAAA